MTFPARRTALRFLTAVLACGPSAPAKSTAADDTFAALQRRGAVVMGVDQAASAHIFEDLPSGGRIIFRMLDPVDTNGISVIRRHLRSVADSFSIGDFRAPAQVHGMEAPGSAGMVRLRSGIGYAVSDIPAGAELRISSADTAAIAAIHVFLAFQRMDHRAAGHDHMAQP